MHLGAQIGGEGVDAAHAHAVETARNLVASFVELTAGVEHCQHHLEGALMLLLVHIHGDTTAVIYYGNGVVGVDCHVYMVGIAGEGLVDRVVDNLINQMMQTFGGNVSNIHGRAFSHRLEAFEHLNITGAIFFFYFCH